MRILKFVFYLTLFSLRTVASQVEDWQHLSTVYGPMGYNVTAFTCDSNGQYFAATHDGSIFLSMDHGRSWRKCHEQTGQIFTSLVTAPEGTIFAGTSDKGIVHSENHGLDWLPANNGLTNKRITSIALNSKGTIFTGTGTGVYCSTDNGDTWSPIGEQLKNMTIYTLALNKKDFIFAGTSENGIFRSTDDGENWRPILNGLTNPSILQLHIDPAQHLFCTSSNGGIFYSEDDGDQWKAVNSPNPYTVSIATNLQGTLYVGSYGDESYIYCSVDHGKSWSDGMFVNGSINTLIRDVDGNIVAGTECGIYRTTDNEKEWEKIGLPTKVTVLTFLSSDENTLFAATDRAVFRSTDNGSTWGRTLDVGYLMMPMARNSRGDVFVGTDCGVFRSTNQGDDWSQLEGSIIWGLPVSSLLVTSDDTIFEGVYGSGVARSVDNGDTWERVNTNLGDLYISSLAVNSKGELFTSTIINGIYRSTNKGETWTRANAGIPKECAVLSLAAHPNDFIFAGTNLGVFRSINNGESWQHVGLMGTLATAFVFNAKGDIFVGAHCADGSWLQGPCTTNGVLVSTNYGDSWSPVNSGLANTEVYALAMSSDGRLLAGTEGGYIFKNIQSATQIVNPPAPMLPSFYLDQNYPNPFNSETVINFNIPFDCYVKLIIYNIKGEEVITLADGQETAGFHSVTWTADNIANGLYFYQLHAGRIHFVKKMIVQK